MSQKIWALAVKRGRIWIQIPNTHVKAKENIQACNLSVGGVETEVLWSIWQSNRAKQQAVDLVKDPVSEYKIERDAGG